MRFDYSIIRNFRNLNENNNNDHNKSPDLKINWDPGINLILGHNGSGKTNLLESLSILSGWGAFGRTKNVINWSSQDLPAFSGAKLSGEEKFTITANISSKISLRLSDKSISSTELRLLVPSILFLTGNVNLIDGSPSTRRLFIDRLCALFYPPFAKKLSDFKYVLKTRIFLLRSGKSPERTNIPYCELGGWIMDKHREITNLLMKIINTKKFNLSFTPEINIKCEDFLRESLIRNSIKEKNSFRPSAGPNYDDLLITLENGRAAADSLSRGQKRRLMLYLIIKSGELINMKLKRKPIMLFDDLTAELDSEGREFVYQELIKTGWQVFITAPENPFNSNKNITSLLLHKGSFLDK